MSFRAGMMGNVTTWQASYVHLYGDGSPGCAARTVEAGPGMHVDLDACGRVIGVETFGDSLDWAQALVRLAMAGRLTVR
jgi:uncharacterized protein YuzE